MIFFSPPPSPHSRLLSPEDAERWRERVRHGTAPNGVLVMVDEIERLYEQYKHLENELDDMTGQFCNAAIHLTRAEDRVRELEEQLQTAEGTSEVLASHLAAASEKITGLEEQLPVGACGGVGMTRHLDFDVVENALPIPSEARRALRRIEEQLQSVEAERAYFSEQTDAMFAQKVDAEAERNRLKEQLEAVQRSNAEHRTGWEKCTDRESQLLEQLEAAQDALRDILDLTTGWTRPMVDDDRKELIERVATAALNPAIVQSAAGGNPDAAGGNSGRSAPSPAKQPEERAAASSPAKSLCDMTHPGEPCPASSPPFVSEDASAYDKTMDAIDAMNRRVAQNQDRDRDERDPASEPEAS